MAKQADPHPTILTPRLLYALLATDFVGRS